MFPAGGRIRTDTVDRVQVDITLTTPLPGVAAAARDAEAAGYRGIWTFEGAHDPFLPLLLAAEHTREVSLGTSIAVAFARNPLLLATLGWDLQAYSGGRFLLGLGTQVRAHVTRRYGMPWSRPAARMRDLVLATREIWNSWIDHGRPLDHRGEFYTHTLMPPLFRPDPEEVAGFGPPPIWLAGVGPRLTRVAGEVADGFLSHPLCTPEYLRESTVPALLAGAGPAGRPRPEIHHSAMVVVGADDAARTAARAAVARQIGFYGSTTAYWPILERHDRAGLGPRLRDLSRSGDWAAMASLIDDELIDAVAVTVTDPAAAAGELHRRFGGIVDRLGFNTPYPADPALLAELRTAVQRY